MTKTYFVHAGAHRSGSSSFQLCMAENRALLTQMGYDLFYPKRDGQPEGRVQLKLPYGQDDRTAREAMSQVIAGRFQQLFPDPDRPLILSEENILGRIQPSLKGSFFPYVQRRAGVIRKAAGVPDHVLVVLRPYTTYYRSAYRMRATAHLLPSFQDYLPGLLAAQRGWVDVVTGLQAGFQAPRLTVVDFAKRGQSRDLLRLLVPGLQDADLVEPDKRVNLSATDAALQDLQARFAAGEEASPAMTREVMMQHAEDRRDLGATTFTKAQHETFDAMYASDLEAVSQMEGVTLIA